MGTRENLQGAFAGESQANRRYLAFAIQADEEGFPQIAQLFRAAAEGETIHALALLRESGGVGSTAENLKTAIQGEDAEFRDMYPGFIKEATAEGERAASNIFKNTMAVEQVHYSMYVEALNAAEAGNDLRPAGRFVCGVCGNLAVDHVPDKCPVCRSGREKYFEVK